MANSDVYLRAMMSLIARQTFSTERLAQIVSPTTNAKLILAFNLCDGSRTQADIVGELKLDRGNFSKTVKKWEEEGAIVRTESENGTALVHVFPLPETLIKKKN